MELKRLIDIIKFVLTQHTEFDGLPADRDHDAMISMQAKRQLSIDLLNIIKQSQEGKS
tara:strand:- start:557 stop:730 length:174 start_codon:yes stop_codon:yes gene_type:complete